MDSGYALLDVGGGARLERFADRLTDRPHPAALGARKDPAAWAAADLRYDRDRGWSGGAAARTPWSLTLDGVELELRPTQAGQVGVFPEHAAMLGWLRSQVTAGVGGAAAGVGGAAAGVGGAAAGVTPAVLHLFAYTGLATLAMAAAGAAVTHVDASRPTVAWARHNAARSGLADRPIRWIVDDVARFVRREARRERRYAGLVLDPPSYGHGPGSAAWRIETDLAGLLEACRRLLAPDGFALVTAHTPGFEADRLADVLGRGLGRPQAAIEAGDLELVTTDGRRLGLGAFARSAGRA